MKNSNSSGGGIIGIIVAIVAGASLVITGITSPSIFKVLLWIVIGFAVVVVIVIVLIVVLGNKAGNADAKSKTINSATGEPLTAEQSEIILNGRAKLMDVRRVLVKIKDVQVRSKGNEICGVMDKILQTLKEKPDKITSLRQFLNYYLPTLHEVLGRFQTLESSGVPMNDMHDKMIKYLGDVKAAMDKQYESLFAGDILDMSVDMEAMTIAIKRDGLLEDSPMGNTGA